MSQSNPQVQQVHLVCLPDRVLLPRLADEAEQRLTSAGSPATTLLYGVTTKRHNGFIILEAARGVPPVFRQWLEEDERVLDYTIHDVASTLRLK